jgi:predicted transcriptional regulator
MAIHGGRALDLPVTSLMTADVVSVTRDTQLAEAMRLMTDGRFRHSPSSKAAPSSASSASATS